MSRKRKDKKKKQSEMARQLGADAEAVDAQKLRENQRVSRPELRLLDARGPAGVRGLLSRRAPTVTVALYLVETSGVRLVGAVALEKRTQQLDKLTYSRPAHFLAVAASGVAPAAFERARTDLRVDGEALDAATFASDAWEAPREAPLAGVDGATTCVAQSLRGVGRAEVTSQWPFGGWTLEVELKT